MLKNSFNMHGNCPPSRYLGTNALEAIRELRVKNKLISLCSCQPCWCCESMRLVTCVNVQGRTPTLER